VRRLLSRGPGALEAAEGYALWAATYPRAPENGLMAVEQEAVLGLLGEVAGASALDVGCGSGRYAALLRVRGAASVAALDLSHPMLARAREVGAGVVRGHAARLPFRDGCFDVAVCALVLGHLPGLDAALGELARVLRRGGVLVYSDVHERGARAGWRRTFRAADGRVHAIRYLAWSRGEHLAACTRAGLAVDGVAEPVVEAPGAFRGWPAAVVVRCRRP
jgi:malonyl-CoA O-methyltransferase